MNTKALDSFFDKIEKLKPLYRGLIAGGIIILMTAPMVYFSYYPMYQKIEELTKQLEGLVNELKEAKRKALELPKLKAKLKEKQESLVIARKSLPESEEIPSLLTSISHSGQDSGLEFLLFKPEKEKEQDFYAEIPVSMNVIGLYHNIILFFDKVSRLNRIVNIKDIKMNSTGKEDNKLNVLCTGVTYKFIEK